MEITLADLKDLISHIQTGAQVNGNCVSMHIAVALQVEPDYENGVGLVRSRTRSGVLDVQMGIADEDEGHNWFDGRTGLKAEINDGSSEPAEDERGTRGGTYGGEAASAAKEEYLPGLVPDSVLLPPRVS